MFPPSMYNKIHNYNSKFSIVSSLSFILIDDDWSLDQIEREREREQKKNNNANTLATQHSSLCAW